MKILQSVRSVCSIDVFLVTKSILGSCGRDRWPGEGVQPISPTPSGTSGSTVVTAALMGGTRPPDTLESNKFQGHTQGPRPRANSADTWECNQPVYSELTTLKDTPSHPPPMRQFRWGCGGRMQRTRGQDTEFSHGPTIPTHGRCNGFMDNAGTTDELL